MKNDDKTPLWSGRFKDANDPLMVQFGASIDFDKRLFQQDIKVNRAWSLALKKTEILSDSEYKIIIEGLNQVREEMESGSFEWDIKLEDIHMAVESRLTEIIGDAGGKIHTGRSRNDQVATDLRLYMMDEVDSFMKMISDVQATRVGGHNTGEYKDRGIIGCSITGLPNHPVENVTLENIRIRFTGGGTLEHAEREIPERAEAYPRCEMFGTLPAYGFFCRHVKNLKFHNIDLGFDADEHRPAFVFDDVKDLDIFNIDAETTPSAKALMWFKHVDGAFIHGCRPSKTVKTFVRLDGNKSNNISLMNNDFSNVEKVLEKGEDVRENAVYLDNNRIR